MVTLKRRASNLFPYGHLYSFIHSLDCTAQFWCPTTEVYTFIYYFDLDPPNNLTSHYGACHFGYNLALKEVGTRFDVKDRDHVI